MQTENTIEERETTAAPAAEDAPCAPRSVRRSETGEMFVRREEKEVPVQVCCCFPWSSARRFISLRDYEGNELMLVRDLDELDAESRSALEKALAETDFVLEVEAIESLDTEFEIRNWKVRTRQGTCRFQTELDEWPRALPQGGLLFRDVAGNLFHVPHPRDLDEHSRKLLWAYID